LVSRSELKILESCELFGELRYRVCVQGTNIVVNVKASNPEEALDRALEILSSIGLSDESLSKLRELVGKNTRC
jgi:hypothetical protein